MTTPEPAELKPWECFYDRSYYDLWAVRLKADRSFGSQTLFHLPSKEEAEALCDILNTRTPPAAPVAVDAVEALALLFHNTYERLAPEYGYSTRHDTRIFDAKSANGRLVLAVCKEVLEKGYTLRRETMTEAELEEKVWNILTLGGFTMKQRFTALVNLVKKYRG